MTDEKKDLRILRTRKLIMDSFIQLSSQKEFKDITVKDITTEAMINRATFYYHFKDIYDLLEKALSEVLLVNLNGEQYQNSQLDEKSVTRIFTAITDFQLSLSNRCHRGYEDTIARIIREQLEIIFYQMLKRNDDQADDQGLKTLAVMLSWGLYGASIDWKRNYPEQAPDDYIQVAIPYLIAGKQMNVSEGNVS